LAVRVHPSVQSLGGFPPFRNINHKKIQNTQLETYILVQWCEKSNLSDGLRSYVKNNVVHLRTCKTGKEIYKTTIAFVLTACLHCCTTHVPYLCDQHKSVNLAIVFFPCESCSFSHTRHNPQKKKNKIVERCKNPLIVSLIKLEWIKIWDK
jgi:hypothetical protein